MLAAIVAVIFTVAQPAQSTLSSNAALRTQSQKVATPEAALSEERKRLSQRLQAIGVRPGEDVENMSPSRTIEKLNHGAELVTARMQALGFQFETSAPLVETPFSNKLSRYGTPLAFTGDSEAIAGFLSKGFEGDMHILTLTLQKVSSPPNQETYQINATLTQIGATSSVQSVPSNEPSR